MYTRVWRFQSRPDRVPAFEEAYGPHGAWARLFHRAQGFLGTTLLKGTDYLTIDRWTSREAYERFMREYAADFTQLDTLCEDLTSLEELVGEYEED